MTFSKTHTINPVEYLLEIQYSSKNIGDIHPSRMTRSNNRIPIIYSTQSIDLNEIMERSNRLESVYPKSKWNYVIVKIETQTTIL